jgi:hypothetical protein
LDEQEDAPHADDGQELLIILPRDRVTEALAQVRRTCRVTQVASPRVAVVTCAPGEQPGVRSIPGAIVIGSGDPAPAVMGDLDDGESLFVAAWVRRMQELPAKQRRGEGLSWDAPGFTPPDAPKRP